MPDLVCVMPEMPGNLGAIVRIAACFGAAVDVVEPCGFPFSAKPFGRAAMDYAGATTIRRHADWVAFRTARPQGRLVLLTTRAEAPLWSHAFAEDDRIVLGGESAGAPDHVHAAADARLRIPIAPAARSLNVAVAAGIAIAEARRQLDAPAEARR